MTFYMARGLIILLHPTTNDIDKARGDKQEVMLKNVPLLPLAYKFLCCIFPGDGRIILAIRLKSVTKIKIYVTGG